MLPFAYRVNVSAAFPAQTIGGTAITVKKANGTYTIALDYTKLAQLTTPSPTKSVAVFDMVTGVYNLTPLASLGSAISIPFTPSGGLSSTNVQDALTELDTEKAAISSLASIAFSGSSADLLGPPVRKGLTVDTTYFVRTDGNDANTGLVNSAGGAFATIQHGLDFIANAINLNGHNATVSVQPGTYTAGATLPYAFNGQGIVKVSGDTTTPANVFINCTGQNCFTLGGSSNTGAQASASGAAFLAIEGFKMASSGTGGRAIMCVDGAQVYITGKVEFGTCTNFHMQAARNGHINITASYNVSGNASTHITCSDGVVTFFSGVNITPSGSPKMTAFWTNLSLAGIMSFGGGNNLNAAGWDATTIQWSIDTNGALSTNAVTIPGTSVGNVKQNGGQQT